MQSIITRYIGPTDKRGSRVSVTSSGGRRATVEWDDALDSDGNHTTALRIALQKWGDGWTRYQWVSGVTKGGALVWVNACPTAARVTF